MTARSPQQPRKLAMRLARHGCRGLLLVACWAIGNLVACADQADSEPAAIEIIDGDSILVLGDLPDPLPVSGSADQPAPPDESATSEEPVPLDESAPPDGSAPTKIPNFSAADVRPQARERETVVTWPADDRGGFSLTASLSRFPTGETVWTQSWEAPERIGGRDQAVASVSDDKPAKNARHRFVWPEPETPGIYQWTVERSDPQPAHARLWSKIRLEDRKTIADHQTIFVRKPRSAAGPASPTAVLTADGLNWRDIGAIDPSESSWLVIGSWLADRLKPVLRRESLETKERHGRSVSILAAGHVFNARLPFGGDDQLHRITLETPADQVADWELVIARPGEESTPEASQVWFDRPPIHFDATTHTRDGWRTRQWIVRGRSGLYVWLTNRNATEPAQFKSIRMETTPVPSLTIADSEKNEVADPPGPQRELLNYLADDRWFDVAMDQNSKPDGDLQWSVDTQRAQATLQRCQLLNQRAAIEGATMVVPLDACLEEDAWIASMAVDTIHSVAVSVSAARFAQGATALSDWLFDQDRPVHLVVRDSYRRAENARAEALETLDRWANGHRSRISTLEWVASSHPPAPELMDAASGNSPSATAEMLRWNPNPADGGPRWQSESSSWLPTERTEIRKVHQAAFAAKRLAIPIDSRAWTEHPHWNSEIQSLWKPLPTENWKAIAPIDTGNRLVEVFQQSAKINDEIDCAVINLSSWATAVDLRTDRKTREAWQIEGLGKIESQSGNHVRVRVAPHGWVRLKSNAQGASIQSWTSVVADGIEVVNEVKRRVTKIVEQVGMLSDPVTPNDVLSDNFEVLASASPDVRDSLAPWMHAQHPPGCVGAADDSYQSGRRCVRMTTDPSQTGRTWLVSPTIEIPEHGRLAVSLACRQVIPEPDASTANEPGSEPRPPVTLRLAFEGVAGDAPVRLAREIEIAPDGRWQAFPLALECNGLLPDKVDSLRLTIDLMTPGEIHLDDLSIVRDFVSNQRRGQIQKQSFLAVAGLKRGNLTHCIDLLQSWEASELLWHDPDLPDRPSRPDSVGGTRRDATSSQFGVPPDSLPRRTNPVATDDGSRSDAHPSVTERIRTWIPNPFRF